MFSTTLLVHTGNISFYDKVKPFDYRIIMEILASRSLLQQLSKILMKFDHGHWCKSFYIVDLFDLFEKNLRNQSAFIGPDFKIHFSPHLENPLAPNWLYRLRWVNQVNMLSTYMEFILDLMASCHLSKFGLTIVSQWEVSSLSLTSNNSWH